MASQLTDEHKRIARDLKKGSKDLPYKQFVYVYAGDIVALTEALELETARADKLEPSAPVETDRS